MATYVEIIPALDDGPFAPWYQVATSGGNIADEDVSFLIIAHDDPEEQDPEQMRWRVQAWGLSPSTSADCKITVPATALAGGDDIITLNWSCLRDPHHFSIYFQSASAFVFTTAFTKLRPNWKIATATAGSPGTLTFYNAAGDITDHLSVGSQIFIKGSTGNDGLYTILTSSFGGGVTTITVATLADGTDDGYVYGGGKMQRFEIPGWARSASFASKSITALDTRWARIITSVSSSGYRLYGNHAPYLYSGLQVQHIDDAGTPANITLDGQPDLSVAGGANQEGAYTETRIYYGSPGSTQDWIQYTRGLMKLESADGVGLRAGVKLSLVTEGQERRRDSVGPDYKGDNAELAYTNPSDIEEVVFQFTHGGISAIDTSALGNTSAWTDTAAASALAHLHRWKELKVPVRVQVTSATSKSSIQYLRGIITQINDWGHSNIQANGRIEVTVKVDRDYRYRNQPDQTLRFPIRDLSTSSGSGYFATFGDVRERFPDGSIIYVRGSTGNDTFYEVSSTALIGVSGITGGGVTTKLFVTNAPVDTTIDGAIELIGIA